jgi:hypothetical protein
MGFFSFFKKKKKESGEQGAEGAHENGSFQADAGNSESGELPKLSSEKSGIIHKWFSSPSKLQLIMELDEDLKQDLIAFRTIVLNYKKKIDLIHIFIEERSKKSLKKLREQMDLIKMMVEIDETKEKLEEKYTIKAIKIIEKIISSEDRYSLKNLEEEVKMNLNILKLDIEKLRPLFIQQLEFFHQSDEQIQKLPDGITVLLRAVKDEALLLGIEHGEIKTLMDDIKKLESMIEEDKGGPDAAADQED